MGLEPTKTMVTAWDVYHSITATPKLSTLAPLEGLEPPTPKFVAWYSNSTELQGHMFGAVDGNRTRLSLLDREVLYPDSYHGIKLSGSVRDCPSLLV